MNTVDAIVKRDDPRAEQIVGDTRRFDCGKAGNIASVGYAASTAMLLVTFRGGGRYVYSDVPMAVYEALRQAKSVGSAFATLVRQGGYEFRKLDDD